MITPPLNFLFPLIGQRVRPVSCNLRLAPGRSVSMHQKEQDMQDNTILKLAYDIAQVFGMKIEEVFIF